MKKEKSNTKEKIKGKKFKTSPFLHSCFFLFSFSSLLLYAACENPLMAKLLEPLVPKPDNPIVINPPVITGITLKVAQVGGAAVDVPQGMTMVTDSVREFTAVVSGTGSFNRDYTIAIDAITGAGVRVEGDGTGKVTVTVIGSDGSFTVTAAATGDSAKTDSRTVQITTTTPVDPTKPPAKPTIANIIIEVARENGYPVSDRISHLAKGDTRVFTAKVIGTGDFDKDYTISVTPSSGIITVADVIGGKKVTANENSGSFTVTATATGDTDKTDTWDIDLVPEGTVDPEDPTDPELAKILGIILRADGSTTIPESLANGASITFTAQVTGTGALDPNYTISVTGTGVNVNNGTDRVTVTAAASSGSFTVTAIATKDTTKTISCDIALVPNFANPRWVIKNTAQDRGRTLNPVTTTALSANSARRYVVFNNEPGATIDSQDSLGGNCFRDVTIMYLDMPIPAPETGFVPFGIQARIKISGHRDSSAPLFGEQTGESWDNGRQGLVMGFIEDPTAVDFGQAFESKEDEAKTTTPDKAPYFIGFRKLSSGQHRMYARCPDTGGYDSQSFTDNAQTVSLDIPGTSIKYTEQLELHDYNNGGLILNTEKKEGFREQEYVVKVTRTGAFTNFFNIYDSAGTTEIFNFSNTDNNRQGTGLTNINNYLAFLVYGVKAEISDIKIFYDSEKVWEDPAVKDAVPEKVTAKRVDITINNGIPVKLPGDAGAGYDYSVLANKFPDDGVPLTAEVVPLTLSNRDVTWTVSGDGPLVYNGGAVKRTGTTTYGTNTFTATPEAGGVPASVKFLLKEPAPPTRVVIDTPEKTSLNDGDKLTLTATVEPYNAPQDVTWKITMSDGKTSVSKNIAYIQPKTGELQVFTATADTEIKVYATAKDTTVVSAAQDITIKKSAGIYRVWRFGPDSLTYDGGAEGTAVVDGTTKGTPWISMTDNYVNNKDLTLPGGLTLTAGTGGGVRWNSSQTWPAAWNNTGLPNADQITGVIQPNRGGTAEPFFKIMDFKVPVKITVIWSHTGNYWTPSYPATGTTTYDRGMRMNFSNGTIKWNPITSGGNGVETSIVDGKAGVPSTYTRAVWSETGTGEVAVYGFTLNKDTSITANNTGKPGDIANQDAASVRIMEIRVEPGG